MSASDRQVRRVFMAMASGDGIGRAAMKAGMHRNTAARHRNRGLLLTCPPPAVPPGQLQSWGFTEVVDAEEVVHPGEDHPDAEAG